MADAVSRCGGVFLVSPTQTSRHRHPELEFNLVTRGSASYVAGNRRYDLAPGSLLWLFPGQEHALVQQSSDLQLWLAFFHRGVLKQAQLAGEYRVLLERDPPGQHCRRLGDAALRSLRTLLELVSRQLQDEVQLSSGLSHLAVSAWAAHLSATESVAEQEVHPAVSRAAALLSQDATASLTQIAATAGVSASRLRHLFHEQTGSTLVSFRNRQRLHRFIDRHSHRKSLLDQSLQAGFGSYAQFHRVFRSLMGVSPQHWLRSQ
jgi:AraC-like DNA-binding protein